MPKNIIMASGSEGATQADIEKVLVDNGYEADKPEEETVELAEPKREDFETDEAFEAAQAEHETAAAAAEEKAEEAEEEKEEKEAAAAQAKQEARHKLSRRQRAIEKATKPLQDQIKKLEEQVAQVTGKKTAEPEQPKLVAPRREDFPSDSEFEDALFDYRYKVRRSKELAEAQAEAQKQAKKQLEERLQASFTDYQTSVEEYKETHNDWDEVVNQPLSLPEAVYFSIVDLGKDGPAVTYYLGKHPEKLEELGEMTPYRAAIEVGRISDRLKGGNTSTEGKPKPKPRVLPAPMRPVGAAVTNSSLSSREAAQKRDFKAFKRAQHAGR